MMLLDPTSRIPLESLPVFPLPNSVLFPEQQLPLHIFEPRYRQMVRDALDTSPYIVVALIEGDPAEEPSRFAPIATAGKIVAHQRLDDGRFNILLEGSVRVSMEEIATTQPYRRVRCSALSEPHGPEGIAPPREVMAMMSMATLALQHARARTPSMELKLPNALEPGRLAFRVTDRLVADPVWRQRVLAATHLRDRLARTTEALAHAVDGSDARPRRMAS